MMEGREDLFLPDPSYASTETGVFTTYAGTNSGTS